MPKANLYKKWKFQKKHSSAEDLGTLGSQESTKPKKSKSRADPFKKAYQEAQKQKEIQDLERQKAWEVKQEQGRLKKEYYQRVFMSFSQVY